MIKHLKRYDHVDPSDFYPKSQLDDGSYATVHERGKHNSVIRIGRDDPGYEGFVKYVKDNPDDPHLPKIYAHKIIPTKLTTVNITRLEKLENLSYSHPINQVLGNGPSFTLINRMRAIHPTFADSLEKLTKHPNSRKWLDMHPGNIMQRKDGTPVITDPWAG